MSSQDRRQSTLLRRYVYQSVILLTGLEVSHVIVSETRECDAVALRLLLSADPQ
jgi:hypothetical protein